MTQAFYEIEDNNTGNLLNLRLSVVQYESFATLQAVYKAKGAPADQKWSFIHEPEIRAENIKTYDTTIAEVERLLAEINKEIKVLFGSSGNAPQSGIELVKWLLGNGKIKELDNELNLTK